MHRRSGGDEQRRWESLEARLLQNRVDIQRLFAMQPPASMIPGGHQVAGYPSFGFTPAQTGAGSGVTEITGGTTTQGTTTLGTYTGPSQTLFLDGDEGTFQPTWDGTHGWITSTGSTPPTPPLFSFCGSDPLSPDDSVYLECRSPTSGFADAAWSRFTTQNGTDRNIDSGHVLRVRHRRFSPFSGDVYCRVKNGTSLIHEVLLGNVTTPTTETFTIPQATIAAARPINYNNLIIEFATVSVGTAGNVRFYGVSLEIP